MEARRRGRKARADPLPEIRSDRDEMNLVEFPFATLSERAGNRTVLEYQVEEFDRSLGRPVLRKLTVTGDPKHGLPAVKDEELYLGLLQLTKVTNEFTSPVVPFTRHRLITVLNWPNRDCRHSSGAAKRKWFRCRRRNDRTSKHCSRPFC